jgi:hypothetical protein
LKQLSLAVANYRSEHGHFPPPYSTDAKGNRLHSWRVLILPYLDYHEIYKQIKLDEPWNSAHNQKVAKQMPSIYAFSGNYDPKLSKTNYLAVVGSNTLWPRDETRYESEIKDGTASTVLVVENQGSDIHWMEPRDLEFDSMSFQVPSPEGLSSKYLEPAVAMADTRVVTLSEPCPSEVLRAMLTIDGGEPVHNDGKHWSLITDGRNRPTRSTIE